MRDTPGSQIISPKLQKIAEQARKYPEMVFNNLYHLIDGELLLEAYHRTSKDSAAGVDKVTAKDYAEEFNRYHRKVFPLPKPRIIHNF